MRRTIKKKPIEIIRSYAQFGLIHRTRSCFICGQPMALKPDPRHAPDYLWHCRQCRNEMSLQRGTPMVGINLRAFDMALEIWLQNCYGNIADQLLKQKTAAKCLFKVFRKVGHFYVNQKVLPFIKLPGPVEVDETIISRQRWSYLGGFPKQIRWVFGMICRSTKIPVLYNVENRSESALFQHFKKHLDPGTVVFSDSLATYVKLQRAQSRLSHLGFYHYWLNHSDRFVHVKFPFVHTGNIELNWLHMKHKCYSLKYNSSPQNINEYIHSYMLKKIVRPEAMYRFMLKTLPQYYFATYQLFKQRTGFQEDFFPNLERLDYFAYSAKASDLKGLGGNMRSSVFGGLYQNENIEDLWGKRELDQSILQEYWFYRNKGQGTALKQEPICYSLEPEENLKICRRVCYQGVTRDPEEEEEQSGERGKYEVSLIKNVVDKQLYHQQLRNAFQSNINYVCQQPVY